MSEAMPEDAIEYWDVTTRTYYERQEDGGVLSRPYNEAENAQADARANGAALVAKLLSDLLASANDTADNEVFLTRTDPTSAELLAHVQALTRQNTRQWADVSALARLALGRLESTVLVLSPE